MLETQWIKVCEEKDLSEGVPMLAQAGDEGVYLVRFGEKVYAVGHECPHYQCKLEEGILLGRTVVCRCHNARFNVTTGKMVSPPALNDLPVYPVKVESGEVFVGPVKKPRFPIPGGLDPRAFLIMGAGAAGNAAAETLRREGFTGRVVMITPEEDLPYDRPNLSKEFLSGAAKPEWLPLRSAKFYAERGIEVMTRRRVTALDPRRKKVMFAGGGTFSFDKALLATGGTPRRLSIPGAEDSACFALRSLSDARAIVKAAAEAKSALVIGAGFIGMEAAGSLRERGLSVTVVAPEAFPLSRVLGDRIGAYLMKRHEANGVMFLMGRTPSRIKAEEGGHKVILSDATQVTADFIVYGLGVQPAVEYLNGTGLAQDGGIPVDARLCTKNPDIYAAGDAAIVMAGGAGNGECVEHWVVAERQGMHAARSMLGSEAAYGEVPFFWTRQTGISLKYAGYAPEWDSIEYRGDVEAGKFVAGFYLKGVLKAAAGVGMSNEISLIEEILKRGIPLSAEKLADSGFDLMELVR